MLNDTQLLVLSKLFKTTVHLLTDIEYELMVNILSRALYRKRVKQFNNPHERLNNLISEADKNERW